MAIGALAAAGAAAVPANASASGLIDSASWENTLNGRTLHVTPTTALRWGDSVVGEMGWAELYATYRDTFGPNLQGMHDQFLCHQQFGWLKDTWNLDEWRPDVGYWSTVAARCNPTGGD